MDCRRAIRLFAVLVAIQEVCARVGATTGRGIASHLRRHHPRPLLQIVVVLLIIAIVINLASDLGAMGAAVAILAPALLFTVALGVLSIVLEVWLSYAHYVRILKWTTLSPFAYVAVAFVAHVPVGEAVRGLIVPEFKFTHQHLMALVAVLCTTISPTCSPGRPGRPPARCARSPASSHSPCSRSVSSEPGCRQCRFRPDQPPMR